jgi:polar amino acid transport system permease protein
MTSPPNSPAMLQPAMSPAAVAEISGLPRARRHHISRWVAAAVILLLLALVVRAFALGQIDWAVVGRFLTARSILTGLGFTLVMTVLAMLVGIASGVLFAVMKMSPNPVLRGVAEFYIWVFRGTPLLLQLLLWFNLALIFPTLGIPELASWRTVDVMTPFVATLLGLGLNQGAYTAEVVRGGILSIDLGQTEAAKAIGMTRLTTLRRIVLPQAMRVIIPPIGNEVVSMVKLTSMASVIQYPDILRNAQTVYYANGLVIELLLVASVWYLGVVTLLGIGQMMLERRFARGQVRRQIAAAPAAALPEIEGAGA